MEHEQDAKETASDTSVASSLRLQQPVPKIEAADPLIRARIVFGGDGVVMELINDFIMDAVLGAREQFFRRHLMAFASASMTDRMFEAIIPTLELPGSTDPASVCENQDPIVQALQRPADAIHGPSAPFVDLYCQFEIPVVAVTPHKTKEAMITTPRPTPKQDMSVSSLASYRGKRHANGSTAPPKEPPTSLDGHRPGVVYSTVPPPRVSPRKAMALLKSAHRLSAVPSECKGTVSEDKPCDQMHTFQESQSTSEEDHASVSSAEQISGIDQRRSRGRLESSTTWVQPQDPDLLGSGAGEGVNTDDILTPIQIEFQVKRHRHRHHHHHHHHHDPHAQADSGHLPDLTPQRRLSNASSIGSELENHEPEFKNSLQFSHNTYHIDPMLSSPLSDSHSCDDFDDPLREREPHQMETMVLAAGVKLQTGEISKAGPELPVFPSRMRRATFFVRISACLLPHLAVLTYCMRSWKITLHCR